MNNPITQEIRDIRHRLAARFDNDLNAIVADLQRQERDSGREFIDRRKSECNADNKMLDQSGGQTNF